MFEKLTCKNLSEKAKRMDKYLKNLFKNDKLKTKFYNNKLKTKNILKF